ncbi:MAG: PQQ-binding-like beta-propeller repeat protein [Acidobacteriota bacterium]
MIATLTRRVAPMGLALLLASFCLATPMFADASTWSGFRAVGADGSLPDTFGLSVAWDRELGPGYSSLAVADGKVLAAFTSGDVDILGAFETASGDEVWRLELGEKYAGHDGSTDGPLATPTVAGDRVYMLSGTGQLVAVALDSGDVHWRTQLDETVSTEPFYGYTSSPVVLGDQVLLMTGGSEGSITSFDAATGDVKWRRGDDSVTYQSPAVIELAGRAQILAPSDQWILGLDAATGETLWSFQHSEGQVTEDSIHATAAGTDRVLLNLRNNALMLTVRADGGGVAVEELWRGRPLSGSFTLPIYHDGHIYGFTGRIFTSVDGATGEMNWRTRAVAASNLSLVGDTLVMMARDGALVAAAASPEAYTEIARAAVFDAGDYADPAFADGRFYVRNLQRLAAVAIDADGGSAPVDAAAADRPVLVGAFGQWVGEVQALPEGERQAAVDAFFADVESTPIVEGSWAHIVHRGATDDVGISGSLFGWTGEEMSLHRIAGTNLFYRSFELDPRGAYDYQLTIDFAEAGPDPSNPRVEDRGFLRQSILHMPEWDASATVDAPGEDAARGHVDRFQFRSDHLDNAREVQIWTPPGYAESSDVYPLLIVNHGDQALRNGHFANVLDNLATSEQVATPIAVFVPRAAGPEYGGPLSDTYVTFLVEELLPHVRHHYRVADGKAAITGVGSAAVISLHAALVRPDHFDRVGALSFYVTDANRDTYWQQIAEADGAISLVRIETGPNDYVIDGVGIDSERSSNALVEKLEAKGIPVDLVVHHGAAGWAAWRDRIEPTLAALLPADAQE